MYKQTLLKYLLKISILEPGVVMHTFNFSTREVEGGGFLLVQVQGQPGLQRVCQDSQGYCTKKIKNK